ncbi:MAG: hypothetical protein ACLPY2_23100 [Bryobacteraceae bacterium]|jgi:hypothetical protein
MAVRAFGRIGRKPATPPRYSDPKTLSGTQAVDDIDGMLRYAEAQVAEAIAIYKGALDRHWVMSPSGAG